MAGLPTILLDISRIDQDKVEIRRERVDVALALRDAVEAVRPQIEEKGQQFEASVPPEPVMAVGDRTRIAQIIANLIGNAIKYTGPDGVIRVGLEPRDRNAVLTVRDSGVGIAPELLPRVFDLFMQADRTDQRGLGIGLALSKKLVELHGGAIEAQSAGLGKGSTFVVRLPLDPASAEAADTTSGAHARIETTVRVLIIDDNRDVADSLAMLLRTFDLAVEAAYDGESGIEAARTFQPDLAFIDIRMPKSTAMKPRAGSARCRWTASRPWWRFPGSGRTRTTRCPRPASISSSSNPSGSTRSPR